MGFALPWAGGDPLVSCRLYLAVCLAVVTARWKQTWARQTENPWGPQRARPRCSAGRRARFVHLNALLMRPERGGRCGRQLDGDGLKAHLIHLGRVAGRRKSVGRRIVELVEESNNDDAFAVSFSFLSVIKILPRFFPKESLSRYVRHGRCSWMGRAKKRWCQDRRAWSKPARGKRQPETLLAIGIFPAFGPESNTVAV